LCALMRAVASTRLVMATLAHRSAASLSGDSVRRAAAALAASALRDTSAVSRASRDARSCASGIPARPTAAYAAGTGLGGRYRASEMICARHVPSSSNTACPLWGATCSLQ